MQIDLGKLRFIDSLNFLLQPLATLPKTFGFESLCKGHFPHLWNKSEYFDYVGCYPPLDAYGVSSAKHSHYQDVKLWRESLDETSVFDFKKEYLTYCR